MVGADRAQPSSEHQSVALTRRRQGREHESGDAADRERGIELLGEQRAGSSLGGPISRS